jgi:hypothetical protein
VKFASMPVSELKGGIARTKPARQTGELNQLDIVPWHSADCIGMWYVGLGLLHTVCGFRYAMRV